MRSFFGLLSLSLTFFAQTSASPISTNDLEPNSRVSKVDCTLLHTGPIIASTGYGNSEAERHYVGLSSDKEMDSTKIASRALTIKDGNGKSFGEDDREFGFYSCQSDFMNWNTQFSRYNTYYGHLAPVVNATKAKHCLTLNSGSVNPTDSLMTDSYCNETDDQSQLLNTFSYVNGYYNALGFLGSRNETGSNCRDSYITISKTGRLHFKKGKAPEGVKTFFLSFN